MSMSISTGMITPTAMCMNWSIHSSLSYVTGIINSLPVSDKVKQDATAVYRLLEAELRPTAGRWSLSLSRGGALDAICDMQGVYAD